VKKYNLIYLFLLIGFSYSIGQMDSLSQAYQEVDYTQRKKTLLYGVGSSYIAGSTGLYFAWYRQNPQSSFHFFDDRREWLGMDKLGHIYSGYNQAFIMHKGLKWAGYEDNKALLYSALVGIGFQSTIEIMDGFSSKWGFSNADFITNIVGVSGFVIQDKMWKEQRLTFKMSYWPISYPSDIINSESQLFSSTLNERADDLYGSSVGRFLKDYNGQTIWLSVNVSSFLNNNLWPEWLSLAIGYSGQNMYGGFDNQWSINDESFILDPKLYPRYGQFVLALDYNLTAFRSQSPFVNTLLDLLNLLKFPAPAVQYNRIDGLKFSLLFLN
jgi:hypothetical protein